MGPLVPVCLGLQGAVPGMLAPAGAQDAVGDLWVGSWPGKHQLRAVLALSA